MDPVTGASNALNDAATLGPDVFLVVIILIFAAGMIWLIIGMLNKREGVFIDVVANNTKALDSLAPILASICRDLDDHDANTAIAVGEIHQLKPTVERIDARTLAIDSKVDRLLWHGEKAPHGESS